MIIHILHKQTISEKVWKRQREKGTRLPVQCWGSRRLSGGKQGVRRAEGSQ